ncbi:MAG: glycine cleavage system protein H [Burkholderiales bacterium]|nr:glycine cleavage system protein H [Burkholderiales bacterium]
MIIADHDFPDDLWLLVEHQVWARPEADNTVTVGITSLGIHLAGEIYMCRLKPVDTVLEQGRSIGVVELAKTIVSVKSAVSGTVLAINRDVEAMPELLRSDPYGAGWLARLRCGDWAADQANLQQPAHAVNATLEYVATTQRPDRWTDG